MLLVGDAGVRLRPVADRFAAEADSEISGKLPGVAKKAAGFFAAAFAAVSVGKFLTDAIGQATDLGENLSKVNVVFGDSAAQIEEFANTASTALGQSKNQALEAAGSFGSLFVGMGLGQQQAADMSTQLVTLASDMASFGNATPQEALDALRSGLVGEAEPLRRFGVMLNAAAIEQEAVRLGLMATGGELTEAAKAQAVYSLAIQQTSIQQGDFGRTSEGLANQQRIMRAQFTDLSTNIGGLFVPALANAAQGITGGLMPGLLNATRTLPEVGDAFGAIGDVFRTGFSEGALAVNDATASYSGFAAQILQVSGFLGDMSSIIVGVYDGANASGQFAAGSFEHLAATIGWAAAAVRDGLMPVFATIGAAVGPALDQVGAAFSGAFGGGGGGGFIETFASILATVIPVIVGYFTRWADVIAAVIPIIADILSGLAPVISGLVAQIGPLLQSLIPVISEVAGIIAGVLVTVLQALGPVIPPLVEAIGQVAMALAGGLVQAIQLLAPILPPLVQAIAGVATALAGALAGALQAILPVLPPLIDALIQLVLAALTPILPILPIIANLIGSLIGALAPLLPTVAQVIALLINLALQALTPILPLLPTLAGLVATVIGALAPFLPLLVQVIALIVQLAIQAIVPLMPFIATLIGMWTSLITTFMPIVGLLLNLAGVFISFGSKVLGAVIGFVSQVVGQIGSLIGWFVGLPGRILSAIGNFGSLLFNKGLELIQGLVNGIASAASFVGNVGRNIVNAVIDFINRNIIDGINDLLEFEVAGITINPPDIPRIPRLHSGGVYYSDSPSGEGLALLRDRETVVTPEDRDRAAALLVAAAGGRLPAGTAAAGAAPNITIEEHLHMTEPTSPGEVAAQTSQAVAWNLRAGVSRLPGLTGATA